MQFLLGSLTMAAVFFVCVLLAYKAGQRGKTQPVKATDEERQRAKKQHDDFQKLMNYNEHTAIHGKKVI